ncbi:scaffold/adaptor protein [Lithospermum erythrorhizon]|uniref:Scaffold/adaptor protein n=1 Tax=Lithospermum erythrorhizon TaxID=34254 RepID=A0AAV3PLK1_LITER
MSTTTRDERQTHVYMAKLFEQAQRYNEMIECMKKVAMLDVELSVKERNMFAVGYKSLILPRRESWRIISSIEDKEKSEGNENIVKQIIGLRKKIEEELSKICNDILSVIDKHLIPSSKNGETTIFYYTLKGDYYRYLAEFKNEQDKTESAKQSLKAYEIATAAANTELPSSHPVRLGLALNYSVFHYEIMNSSERACHLAKQALDDAISKLDSLSEKPCTDSILIMQMLRENITFWTSGLPKDGGGAMSSIY